MAREIFAGLDTGVETTSLCVIDGNGEILQQGHCRSDPHAIHCELRWMRRRRLATVGLEAGGAAIARGLRSLGYKVEIFETRQLSKFLRVRRNKTDLDDARGIAEAVRLGRSTLSRVHLKSLECQSLQSRLVFRRRVIKQRIATVNLLCRQLELYGGRIKRNDAIAHLPARARAEITKVFGRQRSTLVQELHRLILVCESLRTEQSYFDAMLREEAANSEICQRFMEIPGIGPVCALTFYAAIDDPHRFPCTRKVGSYLGLAPKLRESGLTSRPARISKMGNRATRALLVRAAIAFMRSNDRDEQLYDWATGVEARSGRLRSRVALARKLATIMLAMWKSGERYRSARKPSAGPMRGFPAVAPDLVSEPVP